MSVLKINKIMLVIFKVKIRDRDITISLVIFTVSLITNKELLLKLVTSLSCSIILINKGYYKINLSTSNKI